MDNEKPNLDASLETQTEPQSNIKLSKQGFLRIQEWWSYKLPPLFGVVYLAAYVFGFSLIETCQLLFTTLVWAVGAAGFGYYLNDMFDVEEDSYRGKKNLAAGRSWFFRFGVLLVLAAMAIVPWIVFGPSKALLTTVLIHLAVFVLYSAPLVRLKSRGLAGVIADSLYAHVLPVLVIVVAVTPETSGIYWLLCVLTLLSWQLTLGIRNVVEHQLQDETVDRKFGNLTFVVEVGSERATLLIQSVLPYLEVVFLLSFVAALIPLEGFVGVITIVTSGMIYIMNPFGENILRFNPSRVQLLSRTLNQFQEAILPLILLIGLCVESKAFIPVAVLHIILFLAGLRKTLGWFYYKVILKMKDLTVWIFYNTLVWFFFNIIWRALSWVWHVIYYAKNGKWHPNWKKIQQF